MFSSYDVNSDNFLLLAAKAYDKPNTIQSEFDEDLKRVKYVKRLIRKYKLRGDLKERLILNHLIILSNVFGVDFTTRMLFYRIDSKDYDVLKVFLVYLNYMPDIISTIKGKVIRSSDILMDGNVIERLRKI